VRQGHTIVKHIAQHIVCRTLLAYTGVMNHHEQSSQPDRTVELINQVIVTMGGEAVGAVGPQAAQLGAPQEHESPAGPPPTFNQVLDGMAPGASQDMMAVQRLVRERLPQILQSLRRIPKLPSPGEIDTIAAQHGNEPIVVDEPVTVGSLRDYLCVEGGTNREIGLEVYGDTTVIFPGEDDNVTPPYAWQYVQEEAAIVAHTHPNDPSVYAGKGTLDHYHYPSIDDLNLARYTDAANVVFSAEGILLYPSAPDLRTIPSWREHARTLPWPNTGDPHRDYEITRQAKDKYLDEVAGIRVIPWDELPPDLTMQEAVAYAAEQRRQQFEQ
jgi:hypothetical protein